MFEQDINLPFVLSIEMANWFNLIYSFLEYLESLGTETPGLSAT